ncbi:hypothetical protein [Streptomyces sp. UNOB3_S3]|uniref:hypothetical protein n=1 Tax=Streptomyces sp. UNOB3_S3 TaxID=2871682 RepID=UPI001E30489E|nr:hypothetical protein [Streptomyces sp. UNOB3_S3]MCC3775186.1 hypothetical protein [Streptomyces sp. UNOB3_S3]
MSGEADALAVFPGSHAPDLLGGTNETTGWVRVVEACDASEAACVAEFQAEAFGDDTE